MRQLLPALCLLTALACATPAPPSAAAVPDRASIVAATRAAMTDGNLAAGHALVEAHEAAHGRSPQSLLAYSWIARVALNTNKLDDAERLAGETYTRGDALLAGRGMDDEPELPIAIGAAIEVLGQSAARAGRRSEAVALLTAEMTRFKDTSLVKRIQKNLHIVSLAGEPAPALSTREWLGEARRTPEELRGTVVVMFFWAHWCADCKRQGPILETLVARHGGAVQVVAPTQRFGYVAGGVDALPDVERDYIDRVLSSSYPWLRTVPVPLDEANHVTYGVSTTPTIVIVDREGRVAAYHPGVMTLEALEAAIAPLL